jgi:hypothetical protein
MSLVDKLASEGHLTPEQVERIGRNVHEFLDAVDKDPALYKEALEKVSGVGDILRKAFSKENLGNAAARTVEYAPLAMMTAGAGALIGGAVDAGRSGVRSLQDTMGKSRAYEAMLEENPQLAKADPNLTEKAFNTLYRFNPSYAKDPLVAGTFVKNVIDQERMDIGTVSNLVTAHKTIQDAKGRGPGMSDFFMKAMQGGVKGGGGAGSEGGGAFGNRTSDVADALRDLASRMGGAADAQKGFWDSAEQVPSTDPRIQR